MGWSLSREAREKVEGEVAAQAIARFRAKAEPMAKQFGFGGCTRARGERVVGNEPRGMPVPMMRAQAARAARPTRRCRSRPARPASPPP
ncbi:MAG: hypothetical protein MZW92_70190 [Comamonadaceae bacterium]|nr:hypothetical protein [Comamonadaceae bacterium]